MDLKICLERGKVPRDEVGIYLHYDALQVGFNSFSVWFSDIFRGYRSGTLVGNGLKKGFFTCFLNFFISVSGHVKIITSLKDTACLLNVNINNHRNINNKYMMWAKIHLRVHSSFLVMSKNVKNCSLEVRDVWFPKIMTFWNSGSVIDVFLEIVCQIDHKLLCVPESEQDLKLNWQYQSPKYQRNMM